MEMANLVHELEEVWGVSATPQQTQFINQEDMIEVQSEFDVLMISYGESKINVIKALRKEVLGLGLKEAKFIVESVGGAIREGVCKEEAENLKSILEEAGATIEIR
jgi:large subunit ribosomal protein L7/L12